MACDNDFEVNKEESEMTGILDEILSSDNVVEQFYHNYKSQKFKEWLLNLLPEIEACKDLRQDNPWHIYNCLDHILHSVEEMNKQTKNLNPKIRRLLAYTMFFHDLGKPSSYIRRFSKLYNREVDSFFNHNLKSLEIVTRTIDEFGFNKEEKELISLLVKEHDIFMYLTLNENDKNKYHHILTNEYLNFLVDKNSEFYDGKEVMSYLIMVGRADNKSQNPKMTKEALILLDTMDKMLNNLKVNKK